MDINRINPEELAPAVGFSHAVVASGTPGACPVFVAGQTGTDARGVIVGAGIVEQFARALDNLLVALRAAGAEPDALTSLTVYLTSIAEYRAHAAEIGKVWRDRCGRAYPAMAVVEVARLWDPAAKVELQGAAVR
ncbi:enamine deaminase RidA [Mangrovactinospora gilvigrisea]|uniref:Enamine deaminase RidA n=1 Tax=Mangrovactinospora gilvigrisea TaxID=1428644 RepID=A0A1J7C4W1_9ACTN|nr:RidA family protein [Mangrovactinospora gilvigrisea]OIV36600.1 enamine deaminase RidA [Mangrovactinospora gilvigrisea]